CLARASDILDEPVSRGTRAAKFLESLQDVPSRRTNALGDLLQLEKSYAHCAPSEVEKRVALLEQRVAQGEHARIQLLYEQAKRLSEGLHALRVSEEIQDERRQKELKVVEGSFLSDVEKVASDREDLERRYQVAMDNIVEDCRSELLKEQSQRETVHDDYGREIGEEVQRLQALFEKQRILRVEYGEQIVSHLEAEFQKVHDAIVSEQQLRFEAEGMMLRMVEDVCGKLHAEIQQERSQREVVQNKLLSLLEDTCSQIENSFSHLTPSKVA
ncbi:unnamed protein product, partial [Symbiodinium pilosum]